MACVAPLWQYSPPGVVQSQQEMCAHTRRLQSAIIGPMRQEAAQEIILGRLLPEQARVHLRLEQTVVVGTASAGTLDMREAYNQPKWAHRLRELWRDEQIWRVAQPRPREFRILRQGVHHKHSLQLWFQGAGELGSTLKRWHSGAVPFREREWRHRVRDPQAPYCV